jgi:hypothetical protein
VKEVECLCGETVVFLDEGVQVKTCPNCGSPVYQGGPPSVLELPSRSRKARTRFSQGMWMAGLLAVILLVVVIVAALSVARTRALGQGRLDEERADAARLRGDYNTAAQGYRSALEAYERWGADSDAVNKVRAALDEVTLAISRESQRQLPRAEGPVPISLEEIARLAYGSDAKDWESRFEQSYAGRWVLMRTFVAAGRALRFRPAVLSVSYMVLSPQGLPVEVFFEGPCFERYGLQVGEECVVKVVLAGMRFETGGAGEAGRWVLAADGSASSLVTDESVLTEIGWEVDEKTSALIARQASLSSAF